MKKLLGDWLMPTLKAIHKGLRFLTLEEELELIDLLCHNLKTEQKRTMARIIKYKFYSLESAEYWKDFTISPNGITYEGTDLGIIKKHILSQEGLFGKI